MATHEFEAACLFLSELSKMLLIEITVAYAEKTSGVIITDSRHFQSPFSGSERSYRTNLLVDIASSALSHGEKSPPFGASRIEDRVIYIDSPSLNIQQEGLFSKLAAWSMSNKYKLNALEYEVDWITSQNELVKLRRLLHAPLMQEQINPSIPELPPSAIRYMPGNKLLMFYQFDRIEDLRWQFMKNDGSLYIFEYALDSYTIITADTQISFMPYIPSK